MKWSENAIARALALQTFDRRHLVIVPRCGWTGHECDLLVLSENLRVIDVEIKISRGDLKADAAKEKWFQRWNFREDGPMLDFDRSKRRPAEWPEKVWKHYYAVPAEIWTDAPLPSLPSPRSGVLLLTERHGAIQVVAWRRATPNSDAKPVSARDAIDLARLASLRMWNMVQQLENEQQRSKQLKDELRNERLQHQAGAAGKATPQGEESGDV